MAGAFIQERKKEMYCGKVKDNTGKAGNEEGERMMRKGEWSELIEKLMHRAAKMIQVKDQVRNRTSELRRRRGAL